MIDQIIINGVASFDDFQANLKERNIEAPAKKSIKETVPFSNVVYDFSKINGECYWEERALEYTLEIIRDTPEELEIAKSQLMAWLMNISNADIFDTILTGFHYKGTFDEIKFNDEVEKSTVTVKFSAYPYAIANEATVYNFDIEASAEISKTINNRSAHRISPTVSTTVPITITIGDESYAIAAGETTSDYFKLPAGSTALIIKNTSDEAGTTTIKFYEEIF